MQSLADKFQALGSERKVYCTPFPQSRLSGRALGWPWSGPFPDCALLDRLNPASSDKASRACAVSTSTWSPGAAAKLVPSGFTSARASSVPLLLPSPTLVHSSFKLNCISCSVVCPLSDGGPLRVGSEKWGAAPFQSRLRIVPLAFCGGLLPEGRLGWPML